MLNNMNKAYYITLKLFQFSPVIFFYSNSCFFPPEFSFFLFNFQTKTVEMILTNAVNRDFIHLQRHLFI